MKAVRYRDDDGTPSEMLLQKDEQGDFYLSIVPLGYKMCGPTIRFCASGGASAVAPGIRKKLDEIMKILEATND